MAFGWANTPGPQVYRQLRSQLSTSSSERDEDSHLRLPSLSRLFCCRRPRVSPIARFDAYLAGELPAEVREDGISRGASTPLHLRIEGGRATEELLIARSVPHVDLHSPNRTH